MGLQFLSNNFCEFFLYPRQKHRSGFDHLDVYRSIPEGFTHFKGNISHSDDNDFFDMVGSDICFYFSTVLQIFQGHHS